MSDGREGNGETVPMAVSGRNSLVWFALAATAAVGTVRGVTYGRPAPWLDEISNWLLALENGWHPREGAHPLTYLFQYAGLLVSDSTWGLRLYAAVFGTGAVVVAATWMARRFGNPAGIAAAVALTLSPFISFYSADANHYAPLLFTGVVGLVAAEMGLHGPRIRWQWVSAGAVVLLIGVGFHFVGVFPLAAFAGCVALRVLMRPHDVLPRVLPARTARLILALACVLLGGLAVMASPVFDLLEDKAGFAHGATRQPGLNFAFWSALLADFHGAFLHHRWPDVLLGFMGFALSAMGWVMIARRGHLYAAVYTLILFAGSFGTFWLLPISHYFYPKFMAPAVPGMLLGIVLLGFLVVRGSGQFHRQKLLVVLGLFGILFVWRAGVYHAAHVRTSHQDTWHALEILAEETEENAIILTRNDYSSRAFRFLWNRADRGGRLHVALSDVYRCGAPSIQQIRELAHDTVAPLYFVSLQESREAEAEDFHVFLQRHGTIVAHLPSASPDDFVPLDRSITIRRLEIENRNERPDLLPRDGAAPTSIMNEPDVAGLARAGGARLVFPVYTGATYRFATPGQLEGVVFQVEWNGTAPRPEFVLFDIPDVAAFAWQPEESSPSVVLTATIVPGVHEVSFFVFDTNPGARHAGFVPQSIVPWRGPESDGEQIILEPLEKIGHEVLEGGRRRIEALQRGGDHPFRQVVVNPSPLEEGELLVALRRMRIGGLMDHGFDSAVRVEDGRWFSIGRGVSWTYNWSMAGRPIAAPLVPENLESRVGYIRRHSARPRDPYIDFEPLRYYRFTPSVGSVDGP